jgi:hypothetical protein
VALPAFSYFPALSLRSTFRLGPWSVGSLPEGLSWRSPRFESLVRGLLTALGDSGFRDPAIVWRTGAGLDGDAPDGPTAAAMQAAIRFAALDANDQSEGSLNRARELATAENGILHIQPVNEDDGRVTLERGGALNRTLIGGWQLGDQAPSMPDAVVAIEPVRISSKLAQAVFRSWTKPGRRAERLKVAIEWHAMAMANPEAVTLQQRLIAIKTGFEALLGSSNSRDAAKRLRKLFEDSTQPAVEDLPWAGLLWSPHERELPRTLRVLGQAVPDVRSEIEDWFMALAGARNAVIHEGVLRSVDYAAPPERPLSRYKGSLFWRGERILREAVKARLGTEILLCGLLNERRRREKFGPELVDALLLAAEQTPQDTATTPPEALDGEAEQSEVVRSVAELVSAVGAAAPNQIVLRIHSAQNWPPSWEAEFNDTIAVINDWEKKELEAAGAEEELRPCLEPCP